MFDVRVLLEFEAWLGSLNDEIAQEVIAERLVRVARENFGDHKSLGDGVSELRIHYGSGFRAYYTIRGRVIVFMLLGGTNGRRLVTLHGRSALREIYEEL